MNIETKIELVGNKDNVNVARDVESFQRAEQNLEVMKKHKEDIVSLIKERFPVVPFDMASDIMHRSLYVNGEKLAEVQIECRYGKTAYKSVVEGFENYVNGMRFLLSRGRTITGIRKQGNQGYVAADKLLTDLDIIVAGNLDVTAEYNIEFPAINLSRTGSGLVIPADASKKLSANSIDLYYQLQNAIYNEEKFVKAYKKEASKGAGSGTRVTSTGKGEVVAGKKISKETADYMDVVRSLVNVPQSNKSGKKWDAELPYLVDKKFNFKEKCELLPWYALIPKGVNKVYVGLDSLYGRIQELKYDTTKRIKVNDVKIKKVF